MTQNLILIVVESNNYKSITGSLAQWGYNSIVVDNLFKALDKINHDQPKAVIVNGNGEFDVLEMVLSISDIDHDIPIIIIRPVVNKLAKKALEEKSTVHMLSTQGNEYQSELKKTLEQIV